MICNHCGCDSQTKLIDVGIGSYEYWGEHRTHHHEKFVSVCCEDIMVDGGEKLVSQRNHVARKDYPNVKTGQRYVRQLIRHWRKDGPSWYTVKRLPIH